VNGNSSYTVYNTLNNIGEYVNGTNTTAKSLYSCGSWISMHTGNSASVLEAMSALLLAAFSFAYLNLA